MKITQIAVALDTDGNESLYILSDDGKLYERMWKRVPDGTGRFISVHWWKEVDLPVEEPQS